MSKVAIAVTAATMLAACATTGNGNGHGSGSAKAQVSAAGAKQYCLESRLASAGTRHNCNWSSDKKLACEGDMPFTTRDATRFTAPRTSSQCDNGKWVVEMSPLG